ncbi:MAG TPA: HlyD family efflux transporter periplasmic adaptor subunit [Longimicrobium sp.]|jgi:membrane fusion protein (multidrug efflux system)|nr:HlyD family efflux transporter periplasmic adaptor subunit [Longimicrobium sp.]
MAMDFDRTLRSLERSNGRGLAITLAVALALLAGWTAWLFAARVPLYETTERARLEVEAAAFPVAAAVDGRVVSAGLTLGRRVAAGEVLVEIDAEGARLSEAESRARVDALERRIAGLRRELANEQQALRTQAGAAETAAAQAREEAREAEVRAAAAERDAQLQRQLFAAGSAARVELDRAESEARARRAQAQALVLAATRAVADSRVQGDDRRTRIAELQRQVDEAEGETQVQRAVGRTLQHAGELRRVRAPVAGRVADAGPLNPGMMVRAGDTLASIVPEGRLQVTAEFPAAALGRLRPGQRARMRLDAFPWTEYGRLHGRVARVAREPRGGTLRVEIVLASDAPAGVPLEHALPGAVDVEIERVNPATLLLRAAGSRRRAAPTAAAVARAP